MKRRKLVLNKLNLGSKTVGYRVDIVDSDDLNIVTFDIAKNRIQQFLSMLEKRVSSIRR